MICVFFCLVCVGSVYGRSVSVDVKAPWDKHPLSFLVEVSEFLHDHDGGTGRSFWKYVDSMCEGQTQVQQVALDTANSLLPLHMHSLLHTMLAMGHYGPAARFFETLKAEEEGEGGEGPCAGSPSQAFVVANGVVLCSAADIAAYLDAGAGAGAGAGTRVDAGAGAGAGAAGVGRDSWQHVYPGSVWGGRLVLYGLLGSPSFCSLHQTLARAVEGGAGGVGVGYEMRHRLPERTRTSSSASASTSTITAPSASLRGYGVFLDIKNMEYKNVDDSKNTDTDNGEAKEGTVASDFFKSSDGGEEVRGLNFTTLYQLLPQMGPELVMLREQLGGGGEGGMKLWKMQDLGLQTLQLVRSAMEGGAMRAVQQLQETVHNFPRLASAISAHKVSGSVRSQVQAWYSAGVQYLPTNSLYINGRRVDLGGATFNVFDLMADLRDELGTAGRLEAILHPHTGIQGVQVQSVLDLAKTLQDGGEQVRIDVSKGGKNVVCFLNNLERDPQYRQLPRSLRQLLMPSWSIQPIARNLYTLVIVADPLSEEGANLLMQLYMMQQQQYPVRFGVVFPCSSINGDQGAEDFCRLFAHLRGSSPDTAYMFAFSVASAVLEGGLVGGGGGGGGGDSRALVLEIFIQMVESNPSDFPAADQVSLALGGGGGGEFVRSCKAYMRARGLPLNSFSLNGVVGAGMQMGGQGMMQMLGREQAHVAQLYRDKVITDKTKSLFAVILADSGAYSRYNKMLDEAPLYAAMDTDAAGLLLQTVNSLALFCDAALPPTAHTHRHGSPTPFTASSTTLLSVPMTAEGFAAAAVALQWNVDMAKAAGGERAEGVEGGAEGGEGKGTGAAVDVSYQRVAILLRPPTPSGTATGAGASTDTEAVVELLMGLQAALSEELTEVGAEGGLRNCGLVCAQVMQQVYAGLAQSPSPSSPSPQTLLHIATAALAPAENPLQGEGALRGRELLAVWVEGDGGGRGDGDKLALLRKIDRLAGEVFGESGNAILVVHNGRMLRVPIPEPGAAAAAVEIDGEGSAVTVAVAQAETEVTGDLLLAGDLSLLASLEYGRVTKPLLRLLNPPDLEVEVEVEAGAGVGVGVGADTDTHDAYTTLWAAHHSRSSLLLQLSSFLGQQGASQHRYDVQGAVDTVLQALQTEGEGGVREDPLDAIRYQLAGAGVGAEGAFPLQIVYLVDPLSRAGQRAAALVGLLHDMGYPQTLLLVPRMDLSEFPLQNFYRFVSTDTQSQGGQGQGEGEQEQGEGGMGQERGGQEEGQEQGVMGQGHGGSGVFHGLPRQHTLTLRMDVPEPWNVQALAAVQDIDNLRCSKTACGDSGNDETTAVSYKLKTLLVAGQCFESQAQGQGQGASGAVGPPPNGLQLTLSPLIPLSGGTGSSPPPVSDTLVMQNLGYFQLQALPGLYTLDTAPGRASRMYAVQNELVHAGGGMTVAVRSYQDELRRLSVQKRPGQEMRSLLESETEEEIEELRREKEQIEQQQQQKVKEQQGGAAPDADTGDGSSADVSVAVKGKGGLSAQMQGKKKGGSFWSSLSSLFRTGAGGQVAEVDDTVHVFSLATGHMYERLLRIMMLSVTRHCSRKVKFWLFENYLSPSFKQSAAVMAAEYGFEVAYVTYKWPHWLTQQTEQQRIIWGYKILFLDVLFPLNVKKVIYVDADQVVRADLAELWDTDLQGRPYGYVPFCTSRKETLGFQFWQQGYWKDHLRGRPYHISALYVVDLQNFRRHAVGDTLRAVYDQLSRDPNSLANLDQDLPNYAQHQVPIFSLPQEWLWCESWCSDASKSSAKTIDLCNNPLHKEPKLDMARRVVSGSLFNQSWVQLDTEITSLIE